MKGLLCIAAIAAASATAAPSPPHEHLDWNQIRGRFIVVPKPEYPEIARRLHHTGTGLFVLYFDLRGEVSGIRISKSTGYPELDIAALKGLVRWRAKPGPKWRIGVPVRFTLEDAPRGYILPYYIDHGI